MLDVVGDHPARVQRRVLLLAEVVADRLDDAGVGDEGEASAKCTAEPEQPVALPGLGLDGVERDGSDDGQRHEAQDGSVRLMRAVVIDDFGGPEVLKLVEDAPEPEPGDGQVLIKVGRAGINFADTRARENSTSPPTSCR